MRFNQKTAIVTGAGQGIGFDICRQLANEGALVILNDADHELATAASARINGEVKGKCVSVPGDCSQPATINMMINAAMKNAGQVDIIIANAGITLFGDFFSYTREAFNRVMEVNLAGSFFLAQAAANQMRNQKTGGSMLFMSSVTAHQAHKDLAAYGMSKAALEMLAKNLVVEISKYNINVNTIAPGATLTERTRDEPGYKEIWSGLTPMGRPAGVQDITNAALFLVHEESRHITGQNIVIDGGWTSISPQPF